jgi:hypothetical protein
MSWDAASAAVPDPVWVREQVRLWYRNHRGELAERHIWPCRLWFGKTDWYAEPQWLLKAYDFDKHAFRDFALAGFAAPIVDDAEAPIVPDGHIVATTARADLPMESGWG